MIQTKSDSVFLQHSVTPYATLCHNAALQMQALWQHKKGIHTLTFSLVNWNPTVDQLDRVTVVTWALWNTGRVPTLRGSLFIQGKGKVNMEFPPRMPEGDASLFWMVQVWTGIDRCPINTVGNIFR